MRIALDYDGTVTADELLWRRFIADAIQRGHSVTVVTSRAQADDNSDIKLFARATGVNVVFAGHRPKRDVFSADVWIDDMPETIGRAPLILRGAA